MSKEHEECVTKGVPRTYGATLKEQLWGKMEDLLKTTLIHPNHGTDHCLCTSLSLAGNSGRLTQVTHSSCKSSATHSYPRVQYFHMSRQCYGCQCWGLLTCARMLMRAKLHGHGSCTDTVRESALEEQNSLPHRGLEPTSVLLLAFRLDALPITELCTPLSYSTKAMKMFIVF